FDSNILLLDFLKQQHISDNPSQLKVTKRKKNIVEALKHTSQWVNNTAAICKKSYVENGIIDMYINHPITFKKKFLNGNHSIVNFLNYLKSLGKLDDRPSESS